ncbi:MAG TPA: hypothetical protein VHC47_15110, partial [Mucilaginibacter sp.]|nr:hypothetical protein [Mucilaginibacter sp.]
MRKAYLSVIGFALICKLNAHAQALQDTTHKPGFSLYTPIEQTGGGGTSDYNSRALHVDEVDLISSYYSQNGDHSPVTGGIGTEYVTDIANGLDVKLSWIGSNNGNKNSLTAGLGFDHHTSASSAYVALNGGAKTGGSRIYPSLDWTVENAKTGNTFGIGMYYSGEYNYKSKGLDLHWSAKTDDKNGEFGVKLQGYFDEVKQILPSEFVPAPTVNNSQSGVTDYTTASGNVIELSSGGQVISNSKNTIPS